MLPGELGLLLSQSVIITFQCPVFARSFGLRFTKPVAHPNSRQHPSGCGRLLALLALALRRHGRRGAAASPALLLLRHAQRGGTLGGIHLHKGSGSRAGSRASNHITLLPCFSPAAT